MKHFRLMIKKVFKNIKVRKTDIFLNLYNK